MKNLHREREKIYKYKVLFRIKYVFIYREYSVKE